MGLPGQYGEKPVSRHWARKLFPTSAVLLALMAAGPAAWARKWTSSDGQFSTEAELVDYDDGQVTLRKDDGVTIVVPIAKLSGADRRYVIGQRKNFKAATKEEPKTGPSYTVDIRPFLTTHCRECHNDKRAKDGYNVETFAKLTETGRKGAMVVPGKPEESLLVKLFQPGRKHMPPDDKPQPTADEMAKVTAWIMAGAEDDTAVEPPPNVSPEKGKRRR